MQDRPLDHPLESGGRGRVALFLGLQRLVFLVEILAHDIAEVAEFDPAGGHHLAGVGIVDQRQQQVLQRGIFVAALGGMRQRGMEGLFETLGETGHLGHLRLLMIG